MALTRGLPAAPEAGAPTRSLYQQIRLARLWFPLAIVGVVFAYQLGVVPLGGPRWQFWSTLLFYSILGPAVTFATLDWIADDRRLLVRSQSARCLAAYVYAAAGSGESSTDLSWDGQTMVYELGQLLAETERFPDGPRRAADRRFGAVRGARRPGLVHLSGLDAGHVPADVRPRAGARAAGVALPRLEPGHPGVERAPGDDRLRRRRERDGLPRADRGSGAGGV